MLCCADIRRNRSTVSLDELGRERKRFSSVRDARVLEQSDERSPNSLSLALALAAIYKSCKEEILASDGQAVASPHKVVQLVLSECKRKDKVKCSFSSHQRRAVASSLMSLSNKQDYKRHALDALISLLSSFPHVRVLMFEEVRDGLHDVAIGKKDEEEEEEELPKGVLSSRCVRFCNTGISDSSL